MRITFAIPGVVLATIFVTFPYVSREIIPVLNAEGKDEEEAAALMGASGFTIFRKITLPQMKWSDLWNHTLYGESPRRVRCGKCALEDKRRDIYTAA